MVATDTFRYYRSRGAIGEVRNKHKRLTVNFPTELFDQINEEARQRNWSFSSMVVHLCEASIEGIE